MEQHSGSPALPSLDPFIGRWSMQAVFPDAPPSDLRGLTMFESVAGRALLMQRWATFATTPHVQAEVVPLHR